jgi:hypothetical protein
MIQIAPQRYFKIRGEDFAAGQRPPSITLAVACQGCFSPDAPADRNYAKESRETLQAQIDLAPQLYEAESTYQPQYAQLTLQNLNTLLQGGGGQQGLLATLGQQQSTQRAADIADVAALGPQARDAILAANPDTAALLQRLNAQAVSGLDAGSSLTPDEMRQVQQASRAAFAARGTSGTNGALADEILKQYNLGQTLLRQRQQFAGNVVGLNQGVVGDPFLQILGRPASGVGQAQGMLPGTQFAPESPYSGGIYNSNQQYAAMFADPSTMAKVGQISGAAGQFIGGVASAFV